MGLAGGASLTTKGEAIIAIPLLDGRAQAVTAMMIDQVTCAFPMIDSTKVAEGLLEKAANDTSLSKEKKQEIANADITKIAGGKVVFLIGQQYMVIEHDLIYKDPIRGLGLFKSKYRTFHGGKQYTLAGPMVGLRYLEKTGFNFNTFMYSL